MKQKKHGKIVDDLKKFEQKFEKLPKFLQMLLMLYVAVSTIVFGIILGALIFNNTLRELKNAKTDQVRTEQNSIKSLINSR